MTEAEYTASRLTGEGIDFICQANGMFKIKDIDFIRSMQCPNYIKKQSG